MLQIIRDRAQGIVVWFIIILICLAFALVGVNAYLSGSGEAVVAVIDGKEIPQSRFQTVFQQERAFRQQLFGNNPNSAMLDEDVIKRAAMDRLINAEVATQAALDAGFRISNTQLSQQIRQMSQFQSDGAFDAQRYASLLRNRGWSREQFEESLRSDLVAGQMNGGLMTTSFVTRNELDRILRLRGQQRRFGYLVVQRDDFMDGISINEDEITRFYNDNQDRYAIPEQVSVDYLELQASDLVRETDVDDKTLRQLYEEQMGELTVDEERRASHILISIDGEGDAAVAKARAKANDLLKRLRAGESFADMAKQYSDDPGSAAQGGDLGFFGRGVMVPSFEEAAFAMKQGEISDPVRTPYGFHIIKLTDIHAGKVKPFEEVRSDLRKQYLQRQAEDVFFESADVLTNLVYEHPDTLENAAQELELDIKTSPLFTRGSGTGIAADPRIRDAAFSADVLEAGNNSDVVMLDDNHLVVLRIKEHKPVTHRPILEVRDDIIEQLKKDRAADMAEQKGNEMLDKARQGDDLDELARSYHAEWKEKGFTERNDDSVKKEMLDKLFAMKRPATGKIELQGVRLASGDYAVIALHEVRNGDPANVDDSERKQTRDEVVDQLSQDIGRWALESEKSRANIREMQENI